jgi:glycosyltransferase involved in cell wall biosynthesis
VRGPDRGSGRRRCSEVVGNRAGLLVTPTHDVETGLGEALAKLYAEPALRRRMGAAGLDRYRSRWSSEPWAEEREAIIARWAAE